MNTTNSVSVLKGRWAGLTAQAHIDTPLGTALLVASDTGLAGFWFDGQAHHPLAMSHGQESPVAEGSTAALPDRFDLPDAPSHPMLAPAIAQLAEYWRGERRHFELTLDLRGTAFQQAVWQQLLAIDCGDTSTYGGVAMRIDKPAAVRAVGAAVGRNPVSVIVPCHRVVGGNGDLTGYAGGLDRKRALLRLEGVALGEAGLATASSVAGKPVALDASSIEATTGRVSGKSSGHANAHMPLDLASAVMAPAHPTSTHPGSTQGSKA
jgi:methylated-DNA-[protein]-cysteine S-methyltransferase